MSCVFNSARSRIRLIWTAVWKYDDRICHPGTAASRPIDGRGRYTLDEQLDSNDTKLVGAIEHLVWLLFSLRAELQCSQCYK